MMETDSTCQLCAEKLLEQNRELWSEAVIKMGDSNNPDWCDICKQLFLNADEPLNFYHDLEVDD